ncbi:STAS domain-containing protein [Amycolatopsis sp. lyj-23]|uniref:STAS domain-containing protein n=1 Tax=Amycolatopsis sp. lyj-23 TaxID=2789283 RepID=UPI00397C22AC
MLSVRRFGVVPVVIAEGTVDLRTRPQLAHVITAAVARQPADVVIDLTGVGFLSVTGLHVLLDARRAAGDRTRLRVLAAGEPLRMITLTEADQVLAVYSALPDGTGH